MTSPGERETPPPIFAANPPEPAPAVEPRHGLPEPILVETASAPMQLQTESPGAKGPWIKYTGIGTVRVMNAQAWADAGVDSSKYCEWNYLNKKRLPRSRFNDQELQYLLRVDGRFELVEE